MKHRILIEFESDHLPDDFTDQVAGRVYMMPCVKKVECTATLVTENLRDIDSLCALIKAADDACADMDYMLDSNDCISVLRGTWRGPLLNDHPTKQTTQ